MTKKDKKIKLLILAKSIDGGTGTFIQSFINIKKLFKKNELDIKTSVLEKPTYRKLKTKNIKYFQTKDFYPFAYSFVNSSINLIKETPWLINNIKRVNPDIIITIDTHCGILASLVKKYFFPEKKLIVTIHNNISRVTTKKLSQNNRLIVRLLGKWLFKEANQIVGVSKGVSKETKKYFCLKRKVKTIYNGIGSKETERLAKENITDKHKGLFQKNNKIILSIGRFSQQKDFETLIKAFNMVSKNRNDTHLLLIGDGEKKRALVKLIEELRLKTKVTLMKWQQNIYPYITNSDVFILSSHYEGFPYVLLEALSIGIPVISTDCPYGPRESLSNGKYGLLTKPGDCVDLAKKINLLLANKSKYAYFKAQAEKRGKYYSLDKMLRAYKELI